MELTNGATPVQWEIGQGGNGLRKFVGKVIATHYSAHTYCVWIMASDDGIEFDCEVGHYTNDLEDAQRVYNDRKIRYNAKQIAEIAHEGEGELQLHTGHMNFRIEP